MCFGLYSSWNRLWSLRETKFTGPCSLCHLLLNKSRGDYFHTYWGMSSILDPEFFWLLIIVYYLFLCLVLLLLFVVYTLFSSSLISWLFFFVFIFCNSFYFYLFFFYLFLFYFTCLFPLVFWLVFPLNSHFCVLPLCKTVISSFILVAVVCAFLQISFPCPPLLISFSCFLLLRCFHFIYLAKKTKQTILKK